MKVIFIDPPNWFGKRSVERVFGCNLTQYPFPNIFALSNAAILEKSDYEVEYADAATLNWTKNKFKEFIIQNKADVYVIHSVDLSKDSDMHTISIIRELAGKVPIIFTGPAPTLTPEEFIKDGSIYAIRGEAEIVLLDLLELLKIDKKNFVRIPSISWMQKDNITHNPSLGFLDSIDEFPFPARHLIPNPNIYFNPKFGIQPWTAMLTSRGCSYSCIYCVPNSLSWARELECKKTDARKPAVIKRSAKKVIEEFKLLKRQGYKAVSIIDDNFLWEESRTLEICNGIKELAIQWSCLARADHVTENVIKAMASSGCRHIDIGVESFDQSTLDYVKKNLKIEKIYNAVDILKTYKIDVKFNILLGANPFDTKDRILNDFKIIKKLKPSAVMFSIVSPFPGTEYYKIVKEGGWFAEREYKPVYVQQEANVNYPKLTKSELEKLIKFLTWKFYLSPSFIFFNLKRVSSLKGLALGIKALYRKMSFININFYEFMKRLFDIIISIIALIVLLPFLPVIILAVRVNTKKHAIFSQERIGLYGKPFKMYKFRSMNDNEEVHFPLRKEKDDPRITTFGKFLRRTSLDEIPQFWNVLKGEMSLVGPRPLPTEEIIYCTNKQKQRLTVTPGMTGLWQVSGRSEVHFIRWMAMDLLYIKKRSFFFDLYILIKTIPAVITRRGAW